MRQVLQSATEQPRSRFKMTSGRATWGKYVSGIQVSVGYPRRVHNNVCRYPGTIPPPPDISAYCEHNLRQNHFISGIIFLGKSLLNSASGRRYSSGHLDGVQSRTQISLCLTLKSEISASLGRERSGYEIRWCLQTLGHKHLKSLYPVFMPKQNWKAYCFAVGWKAQYSHIWNSQSGKGNYSIGWLGLQELTLLDLSTAKLCNSRLNLSTNNKQLLDEVGHDIRNEVLIIHDIMRKPNSIIVLLYTF